MSKLIDTQVRAKVIIAIEDTLADIAPSKSFTAQEVLNHIELSFSNHWNSIPYSHKPGSQNKNFDARVKFILKKMIQNGILTFTNGSYRISNQFLTTGSLEELGIGCSSSPWNDYKSEIYSKIYNCAELDSTSGSYTLLPSKWGDENSLPEPLLSPKDMKRIFDEILM